MADHSGIPLQPCAYCGRPTTFHITRLLGSGVRFAYHYLCRERATMQTAPVEPETSGGRTHE